MRKIYLRYLWVNGLIGQTKCNKPEIDRKDSHSLSLPKKASGFGIIIVVRDMGFCFLEVEPVRVTQ